MALTNHKHEVITMSMCVRKHTTVVHQPVVHITKHVSEYEWCTSHAHHIAIQFCTHTQEDGTSAQHPQVCCEWHSCCGCCVEHLVDVVPCCGVAEWDGASSSPLVLFFHNQLCGLLSECKPTAYQPCNLRRGEVGTITSWLKPWRVE